MYKPSKTTTERSHWSSTERTNSSSNPQSTSRTPKSILKYYQEFYLHFTTIPPLTHLLNQALYAWTAVDKTSICTPEEGQTIQRFNFSIGRATFNPHHPSGVLFHAFNRHRLPSTLVLLYRVVTIWRMFGRLVRLWQGLMLDQKREALIGCELTWEFLSAAQAVES